MKTYVKSFYTDLHSGIIQESRSKNALAEWLSWLKHRPVHSKVMSLIPGQGVYGRKSTDVSLSLSPSLLPLSLKSMHIPSGEDKKRNGDTPNGSQQVNG